MAGTLDEGLQNRLEQNISALIKMRQQFTAQDSRINKVVDRISRFAGSIACVIMHATLVTLWLAINSGLISFIKPFDPYPFVMLAMIASVEAIFLSTFVLITQNRMSALSERRDDLDVQINLLAEHEITELIRMVDAIATHLGVQTNNRRSLESAKQVVDPQTVIDKIEQVERDHDL